jgi:hypothetical protein
MIAEYGWLFNEWVLTSKYCSINALLAVSSKTLAGEPCRSFCNVAFGSKQELLRRFTVFSYTFADSVGEYWVIFL